MHEFLHFILSNYNFFCRKNWLENNFFFIQFFSLHTLSWALKLIFFLSRLFLFFIILFHFTFFFLYFIFFFSYLFQETLTLKKLKLNWTCNFSLFSFYLFSCFNVSFFNFSETFNIQHCSNFSLDRMKSGVYIDDRYDLIR